jgi:NADH:ubiquinone oxidoreductase subunit 2 (subunit N)
VEFYAAESETHADYAFVALATHNALGASSILYYLVAYTLMSLGAFTVLMVVARREGPLYAFDDYTGLGTTAHGFLRLVGMDADTAPAVLLCEIIVEP